MSYKDKAFCVASRKTCINEECIRFFSIEDEIKSSSYPGGVCFANFSVGCPDIKPLRNIVGEV